MGPIANEAHRREIEDRHRLAFLGVPCYPLFRRFNEMFADWGGVFVTSTYLAVASGGAALEWEYDVTRPIEGLAEGLAGEAKGQDGGKGVDRSGWHVWSPDVDRTAQAPPTMVGAGGARAATPGNPGGPV